MKPPRPTFDLDPQTGPDIHMIYRKGRFDPPAIELQTYRGEWFDRAIALESELFETFRKNHGITPARLDESTPAELDEIRNFFHEHKDTFWFLMRDGEIAANILMRRNYIQALSVAKPFQRQGLGNLMTKFAVNYALDKGFAAVELHVFWENIPAFELYRKIGFEVVE